MQKVIIWGSNLASQSFLLDKCVLAHPPSVTHVCTINCISCETLKCVQLNTDQGYTFFISSASAECITNTQLKQVVSIMADSESVRKKPTIYFNFENFKIMWVLYTCDSMLYKSYDRVLSNYQKSA